jgi:hypothetical protein
MAYSSSSAFFFPLAPLSKFGVTFLPQFQLSILFLHTIFSKLETSLLPLHRGHIIQLYSFFLRNELYSNHAISREFGMCCCKTLVLCQVIFTFFSLYTYKEDKWCPYPRYTNGTRHEQALSNNCIRRKASSRGRSQRRTQCCRVLTGRMLCCLAIVKDAS